MDVKRTMILVSAYKKHYLTLCFVVAKLLSGFVSLLAEEWPQFRGPRGDGTSLATDLPLSWGGIFETPKWKTIIPGRGWSSPVVSGNRIWLTSAESTAMIEHRVEETLESNPHGAMDFQTVESASLLAIEVDAKSGTISKQLTLATISNPAPIHAQNSYASPTAIIAKNHVYFHFGSLGTFCINSDSYQTVWQTKLLVEEITGSGATPVLHEDILIVPCDGADEQYLVALDAATGEVRWKTDRPSMSTDKPDMKRAFSTPLVVEDAGRTQVLSTTAQWLVSYDPLTGNEWWRARIGSGYSLIPRPIASEGVAFVCSGYMKPELFAIGMDGNGDVSQSHLRWKRSRQVPEISSPVIFDGKIYCVSAFGVATCVRASDGEQVWQKRLHGTYSASPLIAAGKIYFTSQAGITTIVAAEDKYRELARNELFGETFASLAVVENDLLIRTHPVLFRIGK